MNNLTDVHFEGIISLSQQEIEDAEGSIIQAVQNLVGKLGVIVEQVDL